MLTLDPNKRRTASDCLAHPWLQPHDNGDVADGAVESAEVMLAGADAGHKEAQELIAASRKLREDGVDEEELEAHLAALSLPDSEAIVVAGSPPEAVVSGANAREENGVTTSSVSECVDQDLSSLIKGESITPRGKARTEVEGFFDDMLEHSNQACDNERQEEEV